jgi:2-hydroxychromene-2-carboxylate isomerase
MATLEFFFDYGSPYSHLANHLLPGVVERTGCALVHRPMLLGGVYKATGNRSPMQEPVEAKRRYGGVEMRRFVEHYGAPFRPNPHFPIDTLRIMRAAHAARRSGVFDAFHAAVFAAFWEREVDLGRETELSRVLADAGLDAEGLLAAASDPAVKRSLRETTDEAVARGAFGAPTFFVGEEMFFGADRLPFVERALA